MKNSQIRIIVNLDCNSQSYYWIVHTIGSRSNWIIHTIRLKSSIKSSMYILTTVFLQILRVSSTASFTWFNSKIKIETKWNCLFQQLYSVWVKNMKGEPLKHLLLQQLLHTYSFSHVSTFLWIELCEFSVLYLVVVITRVLL